MALINGNKKTLKFSSKEWVKIKVNKMENSILNRSRIILFFIAIFILRIVVAQDIKMYPEGAVYGYVTCSGPPGLEGSGCSGQTMAVTQIHDTLINNKTYQVSSLGITRYENKKFYYLNQDHHLDQFNFQDNEYVLYDFGLQVNDTFDLPYPQYNDRLVVTSRIQRLMQNGEYRTELLLRSSGWSFQWIEGIGDVQNGLFYMDQIGYYDIYTSLVCFSDKNGLIYKHEGFNYPCDDLDNYKESWSGINELKEAETSVFPNPFKNNISFKVNIALHVTDASLNLYSTDGLLVKKITISERGQFTKTFDLTELNGGIYIAVIKSNHEKTKYFRIIKK